MIKIKHSRLVLAALTLLTCLVSARAWCAENNFDYTVSGAKGKVLKNIQARLKIIDQKHPRQLSAMRIHHLYTQGFREIKQAVMPFGYFNSLPRGQLSVQNNHWTAHYQVNLGPQLKITRSKIIVVGAGSKDLSLLTLIKQLPVRKGQPFLSRAYNKSKNHLVRAAIERGYLNAKLTQHRVQINRVLRTCRIQWTLATGPRYRFGKTQFSGNLINTELLRRYLTFRVGEYYAENKIRALQKNLQASGYFNSVIVKADVTKARNHVVPIVIALQPARKRHYQAGLGYGTDTGFRGLASLTVNRLNNAGHTMNVSSRISQLQSEINANYIIPGDNPATEHYTINMAVNDTNYHQGRSLMGTTGLSYFRLWHSIHQIYTLNYQIIESELKNKPRFTSHLLMPSVNWQWTHSTHPTNPSSGYYFDILLRATNKSLGSNITFAQAVVHTKWLFPLTKKQQPRIGSTSGTWAYRHQRTRQNSTELSVLRWW